LRASKRGGFTIRAEQAVQALNVLVSEGKLSMAEVYAALKRREKRIRDLRGQLAALEGFVGKDGPFPMGRVRAGRVARKTARRAKHRISASGRAAWEAQGRYMAAVRILSKAARAQIKSLREKSGVEAAIRKAKKMAH
jgi:hypothetical protein